MAETKKNFAYVSAERVADYLYRLDISYRDHLDSKQIRVSSSIGMKKNRGKLDENILNVWNYVVYIEKKIRPEN